MIKGEEWTGGKKLFNLGIWSCGMFVELGLVKYRLMVLEVKDKGKYFIAF